MKQLGDLEAALQCEEGCSRPVWHSAASLHCQRRAQLTHAGACRLSFVEQNRRAARGEPLNGEEEEDTIQDPEAATQRVSGAPGPSLRLGLPADDGPGFSGRSAPVHSESTVRLSRALQEPLSERALDALWSLVPGLSLHLEVTGASQTWLQRQGLPGPTLATDELPGAGSSCTLFAPVAECAFQQATGALKQRQSPCIRR